MIIGSIVVGCRHNEVGLILLDPDGREIGNLIGDYVGSGPISAFDPRTGVTYHVPYVEGRIVRIDT